MPLFAEARYPSLADRAVFVTGGASGIGESIVTACARQGMKVGFVDRDAALGEALVGRLSGDATIVHAPHFVAADVTDTRAVVDALRVLRIACGAFTGLVNNAANDQRLALDEVTPEAWDAGMAVNLKQMFFSAQAVMPDMRTAGGGSIVNLGSASWRNKQGGMPVYTTAKSAVTGLTRSLARDLGPLGVRVNTVVPGWVMTEKQLRLWATEEARADVLRVQCLAEHLQPEDIARMTLFLLADDSRMCTAQDFIVDAGWS